MCVTGGNTGWNTRVNSSGKEKDQRYVCLVGGLVALFLIYSLVNCTGRHEGHQALF